METFSFEAILVVKVITFRSQVRQLDLIPLKISEISWPNERVGLEYFYPMHSVIAALPYLLQSNETLDLFQLVHPTDHTTALIRIFWNEISLSHCRWDCSWNGEDLVVKLSTMMLNLNQAILLQYPFHHSCRWMSPLLCNLHKFALGWVNRSRWIWIGHFKTVKTLSLHSAFN